MQDYFEHFGILGQKWGVKNGPPYPLGPDVSTGKKLKKEAKKIAKTEKKEAVKTIKKETNKSQPDKMYKHRKEYTVEELEKENRRFRAEEEMFNHSEQYRRRGAKFVQGIVQAGVTVSALSNLIKKVGDIKIPPELAEKILGDMIYYEL